MGKRRTDINRLVTHKNLSLSASLGLLLFFKGGPCSQRWAAAVATTRSLSTASSIIQTIDLSLRLVNQNVYTGIPFSPSFSHFIATDNQEEEEKIERDSFRPRGGNEFQMWKTKRTKEDITAALGSCHTQPNAINLDFVASSSSCCKSRDVKECAPFFIYLFI